MQIYNANIELKYRELALKHEYIHDAKILDAKSSYCCKEFPYYRVVFFYLFHRIKIQEYIHPDEDMKIDSNTWNGYKTPKQKKQILKISINGDPKPM